MLFLLIFIIIQNLISHSVSQDNLRNAPCHLVTYNFTTNSTYQTNLDLALSSLTSDTSITYGFYNLSVGQIPDQVNAIGMCRGDVQPDDCRRCINDASARLPGICPNKKGAIGWYANCMLKYSNETILGNPDQGVLRWDQAAGNMNASEADAYNQRLRQLFDQLRTEAARGGSLRKYASNTTDGPGFSTIYGYMQCTPDLTEIQCENCLGDLLNSIPSVCCGNRRRARVFFPSCILRYGDSRFLNDTASLAPPPPPPPPPTPLPSSPSGGKSSNSTTVIVIIVVLATATLVVLSLCVFMRRRRRRRLKRGVPTNSDEDLVFEDEDIDEIRTPESLQYRFSVIKAATNEFSDNNKLGEGGFGPVYKGELQNGKEIAVKRLSMGSGQGENEFKNEVLLLARLQHRNLVRLLGFSLEGSERLLMYEFVENGSLDRFLFDPTKRAALNWDGRYKIIGGIARGLLYLHEDSRLKIIHRDMKPSNVLLDSNMNPKIADFGTARLFKPEETRGNTDKIVGTLGYMAPEYLMQGEFSIKSDVFSFGVLVLEIVTGKRTHSFENGVVIEDLISHAWKSWKNGTTSNLIDPVLRNDSCLPDMIRCIHIGLLCVQEDITQRPTMASVVLMLSTFSITLQIPSEPAFIGSTINSKMPLFEDYSTSSTSPPKPPEN